MGKCRATSCECVRQAIFCTNCASSNCERAAELSELDPTLEQMEEQEQKEDEDKGQEEKEPAETLRDEVVVPELDQKHWQDMWAKLLTLDKRVQALSKSNAEMKRAQGKDRKKIVDLEIARSVDRKKIEELEKKLAEHRTREVARTVISEPV